MNLRFYNMVSAMVVLLGFVIAVGGYMYMVENVLSGIACMAAGMSLIIFGAGWLREHMMVVEMERHA